MLCLDCSSSITHSPALCHAIIGVFALYVLSLAGSYLFRLVANEDGMISTFIIMPSQNQQFLGFE